MVTITPLNLYLDAHIYPEVAKAMSFFQKTFNLIKLDGSIDYREQFKGVQRFFLTSQVDLFQQAFEQLADEKLIKPEILHYNDRTWRIEKSCGNMAWLDFEDVLQQSRSGVDFEILLERFQIVFLTGVPVLTTEKSEAIRRFITFVDLIYEEEKTFFLCAEAVPKELCQLPKPTRLPLDRMISRLTELCNLGSGITSLINSTSGP